jgi:hypothetical protein
MTKEAATIQCTLENISLTKIYYSESPETGRCFITTAFQLYFGIPHWEGPREPGRAEIERDSLTFGVC